MTKKYKSHPLAEQDVNRDIALPSQLAASGTFDPLVENARDYAKASTAENTNKAYAADWKHFACWCRLKGTDPLPPSPELVGLYLTDLAAPTGPSPALTVSTIERRLSGLAWSYTQRGFALDRKKPAYRHRAGGDQAQTCAPSGAERGNPDRGHPLHGRHPAPRSARASRPGHVACGLCGRSQVL